MKEPSAMTTNPTDQTPNETPTSTWMSGQTVAGMHARHADLIKTAQECDTEVAKARKELVDAETRLGICQSLADNARKEVNESNLLLAIAQGRAPVPTRDQIRVVDDGLGLALGALRIAVPPDDATPEDLVAFAGIMRSLYAAASAVAHRADEAARAAAAARGPRPWTPDVVNSDGSTTVTMQRSCNGCGNSIGDLTEAEAEAGIKGEPLPDVRAECPTCTPLPKQPAAAPSGDPLQGLPAATAAALSASTADGDAK